MALTVNVNSYVTLADAVVYFGTRLDAAAWDAAAAPEQEKALVTATNILESLIWVGTAVSESQILAFPREGSYFDPRVGYEVLFDTAVVPDRIKTATYELAYHLLNNDGLLDETGNVKQLSLGSVSLSDISKPDVIPSIVKRYISPLLFNRTNSWWRAN